jgi:hypothetical protein
MKLPCSYKTHIKPFSNRFSLIKFSNIELERINRFVLSVIDEKKKESHHKIDNRSEYKRFFTGTLGELALEKYLGIDGIVDWSVGNSKKYHKPDLSNIGIRAGIKTVEYGLFPIIFKKSHTPEIINISWKSKYVYMCGLATVDILNNHQSIDLIKDERLRKRGTKTGFYGFEYLHQFKHLEELKELLKK